MKLPNVKKILIIRNDGIGDAVLSAPAIAWLKRNYPNSEITVFARSLNAPIFKNNPDLDRVIIFDKEKSQLLDQIRFFRQIRREAFDLVIVMKSAWWTNFLAMISGAKYRVGYNRKRFRFALTHKLNFRYKKGDRHFIDRFLDLFGLVCDGDPDRKLILNLSDSEIENAHEKLRSVGVQTSDFVIGIHPGGSSFEKRWNETDFAQIADLLISTKHNVKILLLRGPDEIELERNIAKSMKFEPIVISPKSIRELAAIISECDLLICNDSGPMHIASALDVPTIAIFGPTDHVAWRPMSSKNFVVRREMPCWPCSPHRCQIGWECVKKLPVSSVWEKIEKVLD